MKLNNYIKERKYMNKLLLILVLFLTSCAGAYYISDAEYADVRESHSSLTYWEHNGNLDVYWGWNNGWYYYYGKPHYYPWYYYYNTCPPYSYNTTTHIIIVKPVNKPTWRPNKPNRPNRPNWNNNRTNNRPNNNNKVIINKNRNNKVNINKNRSTNKKRKRK